MKKGLCLALVPALLSADLLEEKPWFGSYLEFHLRPEYSYAFFSKVDNAIVQPKSTIFNHFFGVALETTAPIDWNWQVAVDFLETTQTSLGWRSAALSGRKLWLDDVCGDPVSLTTGLTFWGVPNRMLKDISVPFHGNGNFELHTAIGKEWNQGRYWYFRTYGLAAIGIGTKGAPWLRGDLHLMGNYCDYIQCEAFLQSLWGLGSKTKINIDDFKGYANIGHHSIDIGGNIRFLFNIWGWLQLEYWHRVYARSFPEHVNTIQITYNLPFCPF